MNEQSSPLPKKFGARVREARKSIGMSQEELAFQTGLDRTYISGIERGIRNPALKNVERIAKALKTSPESLIK